MATPVTETVGIAFVVEDSEATAALNNVATSTANLEENGQGAASGMNDVAESSDRAGGSLVALKVAFLAAAAAMAFSVNTAKDFEQAMDKVAAVSGVEETGRAFQRLEGEARRLGASTTFTANEAAEGLTFLAMAGFEAADQLASLEGVLQLAQAGGMALGRAADLTTNILSGFNLEASQTVRVVDVLAKAASTTNTNVEELGEGMKYLAPAASALNIPLEQATALLGILANNGLKGGIAGRNLQTALVKLVAPTKQARGVLKGFGIALSEIDPTVVGLQSALERLSSMGIADLSTIFGVENLKAVLVTMKNLKGEKGLEGMTDAMNTATGTGKEMSDQMTGNFASAIERAKSAFGEFQIALVRDSGFLEWLTEATDGVAAFIQKVANSGELDVFLQHVGSVAQTASTAFAMVGKAVTATIGPFKVLNVAVAAMGTRWLLMRTAAIASSGVIQGAATRVRTALASMVTATKLVGLGFVSMATRSNVAMAGLVVTVKGSIAAIKTAFLAFLPTAAMMVALEVFMRKLSDANKILNAEKGNAKLALDVGDIQSDVAKALEEGISSVGDKSQLEEKIKSKMEEIRLARRNLATEGLGEAAFARQVQVLDSQANILQRINEILKERGGNQLTVAIREKAIADAASKAEDAEIQRIARVMDANKEATADALKAIDKIKEKQLSAKEDGLEIKLRLKAEGVSTLDELRSKVDAYQKAASNNQLSLGQVDKLESMVKAYTKVADLAEKAAKAEAKSAAKRAEAETDANERIGLLSAKLAGDSGLVAALEDAKKLRELTSQLEKSGVENAASLAKEIVGMERALEDKDIAGKAEGNDVVASSLAEIGGGGNVAPGFVDPLVAAADKQTTATDRAAKASEDVRDLLRGGARLPGFASPVTADVSGATGNNAMLAVLRDMRGFLSDLATGGFKIVGDLAGNKEIQVRVA